MALLATLTAVALLFTACTSTAETASEKIEAVDIPPTPVGEQTRWVIDALNSDEEIAAAELEPRLDRSVLEEVSSEELLDVLNRQIGPARPLTPTAYRGSEEQSVTRLESPVADPFELTLTVAASGRMIGIFFGPPQPEREPAASIDEIEERFAALDTDVAVLVSEVAEGTETTLLELDGETAMPLASVAKLYVLGAVIGAIEAGELDWQTELEITPAVRSLPSGELQNAPDGTLVTVREAAQKMIEISDNTPTDLLIAAVGRERVEATVERFDHHEPGLLRPFIATRELFELLWGADRDLPRRWANGDERERRDVLAAIEAQPLGVTVDDATHRTGWQNGLDWFATPRDVTTALRMLDAHSAQHPELREILAANPGVGLEFDAELWPYLGFKGGSSIGVLSGAWIAEDAPGRSVTVVVQAATREPGALAAEQFELFGLVEDLLAVLG